MELFFKLKAVKLRAVLMLAMVAFFFGVAHLRAETDVVIRAKENSTISGRAGVAESRLAVNASVQGSTFSYVDVSSTILGSQGVNTSTGAGRRDIAFQSGAVMTNYRFEVKGGTASYAISQNKGISWSTRTVDANAYHETIYPAYSPSPTFYITGLTVGATVYLQANGYKTGQ